MRRYVSTPVRSRQSSPYHLVRITVWRPSLGPWSSPRRDLMDCWCCAPNLVPPSLQKSLDDVSSLNFVHGFCTAEGVRPRSLRGGKRKRKRDWCPVSRSQLSSVSLGWCGYWRVSGIVTGASSTRRQLQNEAWQLLRGSVNVYHCMYLSCFTRCQKQKKLLSLQSHKCARTPVLYVTPPRDSWAWIVQQISAETFWKYNGFLCNQISSAFLLRVRSLI